MSRDYNLKFRQHSIYLSDEVLFYSKLRKNQLIKGTTADLTIDQVLDGDLRNKYTTQNPHWVTAWDALQQAKQDAIKRYHEIETEAIT